MTDAKSPRRKTVRNGTDGSESARSRASNCQMENTYKLKPDRQEKFQSEMARKIMLRTMESKLNDVVYNPATCGELATKLTNDIMSKIKQYHWSRYKLVVQVFVGQEESQGVQVASRCVWNVDTDMCTCVYYRNSSLFAVASCFAVYYE